MGYRIEYDSRGGKYEIRRTKPHPLMVLLGCVAGLALVLIFTFGEEGANYIREALIPGDNRITAAAVRALTERLQQGEEFGKAVAAFCGDVISGTVPAN